MEKNIFDAFIEEQEETKKVVEETKPEKVEETKTEEVEVEIVEEVKPEQKAKVETKTEKPKKEKKEATKEETTPTTTPATTKKGGMKDYFITAIQNNMDIAGRTFTTKDKEFALDIIASTDKMVRANGYDWRDIDFKGNKLDSQIQRWAKLGVTSEDKLYIDIRANKHTNMLDIQIKPQYQTLEKLIRMYFAKKVYKFYEDVICIGDKLNVDFDFETGDEKVVSFTKNNDIDRNKMENITGAFKIIYYVDDDGSKKQLVVQIDKNRIMRAYNASPSKEKTVWNQDTRKMVLKTVTWEMWNNANVRAFMIFPDEIISDIGIVNESEEMEWNKETKHKSVEDAQDQVIADVATGEIIDI